MHRAIAVAKLDAHDDPRIFWLLSLSSVVHACRTISDILSGKYTDDCLAIVRGIYEQYLRAKGLRFNTISSKSLFYNAMASQGLFPYAQRKNGKPDYRTAIDLDGNRVDITISNVIVVESSQSKYEVDVYYQLYNRLSGFVHRDTGVLLLKSLHTGELHVESEDDPIAGTIFSGFVMLLVFAEFAQHPWLPSVARRDLRFKSRQLLSTLSPLCSSKRVATSAMLPNCLTPALQAIREELDTMTKWTI